MKTVAGLLMIANAALFFLWRRSTRRRPGGTVPRTAHHSSGDRGVPVRALLVVERDCALS